jgi:hypothetical protein
MKCGLQFDVILYEPGFAIDCIKDRLDHIFDDGNLVMDAAGNDLLGRGNHWVTNAHRPWDEVAELVANVPSAVQGYDDKGTPIRYEQERWRLKEAVYELAFVGSFGTSVGENGYPHSYAHGMAFEISEMGPEYIFEDWRKEILALALPLLERAWAWVHEPRSYGRHLIAPQAMVELAAAPKSVICHLATVWEFEWATPDQDGEYDDNEYSLVGLLPGGEV